MRNPVFAMVVDDAAPGDAGQIGERDIVLDVLAEHEPEGLAVLGGHKQCRWGDCAFCIVSSKTSISLPSMRGALPVLLGP